MIIEQGEHYLVDGVQVVRLSTILNSVGLINYSGVPAGNLEHARLRGEEVDSATEEYDQTGILPYGEEEVQSRVVGWHKFKKDRNLQIVSSQTVLNNKNLGYACRPDRIIKWEGSICTLDIKCTAKPEKSHFIQAAGQRLALISVEGAKSVGPAFLVYLYPNEFKVKLISDKKFKFEELIFMNALNIYKYKQMK